MPSAECKWLQASHRYSGHSHMCNICLQELLKLAAWTLLVAALCMQVGCHFVVSSNWHFCNLMLCTICLLPLADGSLKSSPSCSQALTCHQELDAVQTYLCGCKVRPLTLFGRALTGVYGLLAALALQARVLLLPFLSSSGFTLSLPVFQSIRLAGLCVSLSSRFLRTNCFTDAEGQCRPLPATHTDKLVMLVAPSHRYATTHRTTAWLRNAILRKRIERFFLPLRLSASAACGTGPKSRAARR